MKGVLPRATIGRPALRAALVSIEISTLTFFWNTRASNAFCAPAAPEASSATSSASGRPSTPPLVLISSTASSADCTTGGSHDRVGAEKTDGTADPDGVGGKSGGCSRHEYERGYEST